MATFIVTYDVKDGDERSANVVKALEKMKNTHVQLSVWIVEGVSADSIFQMLIPLLDNEKDKLFVCQLTGQARVGKYVLSNVEYGRSKGWSF